MAQLFFRDEENAWIKGIKFNDLSSNTLLQILKTHPRRTQRSSAVLFDLDSTLFNLGKRNQQIFGDFLRQEEKVPLFWHKLYAELGLHNHEYHFDKTFLNFFRRSNPEEAERLTEELMKKFWPFWQERFFSNWPLFYDQPYEGAQDFVTEVLKMGMEIVYLTGRDRPGGQGGTMASLKRWNFPWNLNTHLYMKPAKAVLDLEFKAEVSDMLRHRFELLSSIDNEPENCVMFAEKFPEAEIVFFHSIMSSRMPLKNYHEQLGTRKAHRLTSYAK